MDKLTQYIETDADGFDRVGLNVESADGTVASAASVPVHQNAAQRLGEYARRFAELPKTAYCGDKYANFNKLMQPRGLCFIGGDPASGKTSFLLNVVANRITAQKPTIFLTFEMSAPEILQRLAAVATTTDAKAIHSLDGFATATALQYLTLIEPADTANECGAFEVERISADVANIRAQYGENADIMIIIDSLNMLDVESANDERRAVNTNIRLLSKFTKTNNVTTFCIAQSNRESNKDGGRKYFPQFADDGGRYDFTPLLYTFRESSLIEYIADCVFYVLKVEADADATTVSRAVVSVKHRFRAPNSFVMFDFDRPKFTFTEKNDNGF